MVLPDGYIRSLLGLRMNDPSIGHRHLWARVLSRRRFLGSAAFVSGAALTTSLWLPAVAEADDHEGGTPRPIPQTLAGTPFHVQLPGPNSEPSLITDFVGQVAIADIQGTAASSPTDPGNLTFDADMRFMNGRFVGTDGHVHHGTFGFV